MLFAAGCLGFAKSYGELPLAFEANTGQTDPRVLFTTRTGGLTVFFTANEAVMVLGNGQVARMKMAGAGKPRQILGLERLPGISNYFIGNDPQKWRTRVPNYARIRYEGVYPGIDVTCYGQGRQLEYDLVVAPGADPRQIELTWEGVERLERNAEGDLVMGSVVQKRPRVYQEYGGRRVEVAANYVTRPGGRVGFRLARYDRSRPLVIDPVILLYSTYLGGSSTDTGNSIAVDASGSAYIAGTTSSTDFPTVSPYQSGPHSNSDVFVTKLSPSGNSLIYSTYLGGGGLDFAAGIAVDSSGSAYVTGGSYSTDFPMLASFQAANKGDEDAFVTKLSPSGSALVYSTFLGGSGTDAAAGIAVDSSGSAYVTGFTSSPDFPTQAAYQPAKNVNADAFVAKFSPAGNTLVYATYFGGSGFDQGTAIAVDSAGSAYVTGFTQSADLPTVFAYQGSYRGNTDVFVTKFSPAGNTLFYSTYLGGSSDELSSGIAVDAAGSAYVTGRTESFDFPTQSPFQAFRNGNTYNAFVTKLAPAGNTLAYSTYLGGTSDNEAHAIAVDSSGAAYVTGYTASVDFPTLGAYQSLLRGSQNAFVTELAAFGNALVFSTFLGGSGQDQGNGIAVDSAGAVYITGNTGSVNFPTQTPYQASLRASDAFVSKLLLAQGPAVIVTTNPAGLTVFVDGVALTAPQVVTWAPGTLHNLSVASPQAGAGARYAFLSWSDGGAQTHIVTAPATTVTYTANFAPQYALTLSVVNAGCGSIAATPPSSDGYYASGALVQLTAVNKSPCVFTGWGGDLSGTANPQFVTMNSAHQVSATFGQFPVQNGPYFVAVTPCRVADTRGNGKFGAFGPPSLPGGSTRDFPIQLSTCAIPSGVQAYSLNITVVPPGPMAFLSAFPTGQPQLGVSTLNSFDGEVVANAAIVPASASGSITIYVSDPTDVIIDINGYFLPPGGGGLAFYPVTPCRVADTRGNGKSGSFGPPGLNGGTSRDFPILQSSCGIPSTAQAYSLNMTVVPPGPLAYLTTWPSGHAQPTVSTLNSFLGKVVANAAIVAPGSNGAISVFVSDPTDLIIDINGYFAAPGVGGLSFSPVAPCRLADTRTTASKTGAFGPPSLVGGASRDFPLTAGGCGLPSSAQAYSLNLTAVPPAPLIYLSVWPSGQPQPVVSTLNSFDGRVVANAALLPAGNNGSVSVYASNPTDLIIDVNGYFAP